MKRADILENQIDIPEGPEAVRPVDPDVERLLTLLSKVETAKKQGGGLGRRTANHFLSAAGQLLADPNGRELYGNLPGEVIELVRKSRQLISPNWFRP